MFESLTSTNKLLKLAREGRLSSLEMLVSKGCQIDKRHSGRYTSPLDQAVEGQHIECVEFLLSAGSPLGGTAIIIALNNDFVEVLKTFHRHCADFYKLFSRGCNGQGDNPYLNRWQLHLTALDYSITVNSTKSTDFLLQIGMQKRRHINCKKGHYAPWVSDSDWVTVGGVNIDGRCSVTEGFYCPVCEHFVK